MYENLKVYTIVTKNNSDTLYSIFLGGSMSRFWMRNDMVHRTLCDALEDSRRVISKLDRYNHAETKSVISGLIEEIQTYGNRMEAALAYSNELVKLHEERKKYQAQVDDLKLTLNIKEEEE